MAFLRASFQSGGKRKKKTRQARRSGQRKTEEKGTMQLPEGKTSRKEGNKEIHEEESRPKGGEKTGQ